jgi:hypothetical protein
MPKKQRTKKNTKRGVSGKVKMSINQNSSVSLAKKVGKKKTKRMNVNKRSLAKKYWRQIRGNNGTPRKSKSKRTKKGGKIQNLEDLMTSLRL